MPYRAVNSSPAKTSLVERGAQIIQPDSPDQLKVLSQAKGQSLGDVKGYTYDDTAGQDVRVYIIDSGVKTDHEVSQAPTEAYDLTDHLTSRT